MQDVKFNNIKSLGIQMKINKKLRHIATRVYFHFKESTYKGRLKYIYEKHSSDKLIVIFSSFADKPVYNYTRTLIDIRCNKLFILDDFGYRGSYYWYEHGKPYPLELVSSLIRETIRLGGVKSVITLGSSKGGTCAIYYGLLFRASHIYAGANQYYVGKYLNKDKHNRIFKEMMGSDASKKEQELLDNMLPNMICQNKSSESIIHLLYSKKEHTYIEHIKPLIKKLNINDIKHYDKVESFENHSDVGKYFSPWIKSEISKLVNNV